MAFSEFDALKTKNEFGPKIFGKTVYFEIVKNYAYKLRDLNHFSCSFISLSICCSSTRVGHSHR